MSDLNAIFELDPHDLTIDDERLTIVIEGYRAKRAQYNLGNTQAGKVNKKKEVKGVNVEGLDLDLKL